MSKCTSCGQETARQSRERRGLGPIRPSAKDRETKRKWYKSERGIKITKAYMKARKFTPRPGSKQRRHLTPTQVIAIWEWDDLTPPGLITLSQTMGTSITVRAVLQIWHRRVYAGVTATLTTLAHHSQWSRSRSSAALKRKR